MNPDLDLGPGASMLTSYDDAYEHIRTMPGIRRLEIGEFLFAQFTCEARDELLGTWTHTDVLVHVVSGKKTYRTHAGRWLAEAGQTVFMKKGAYVLQQHTGEENCACLFFIPDRFIRDTVRELAAEHPADAEPVACSDPIIRVENDAAISAFLSAIAVYFDAEETPAPALLRLKVKELVTGILIGLGNRSLSDYFRSVASSEAVAISEVMEHNFCQNLAMEEFARLCHRSLSTFKREFRAVYGCSPGRWLLDRRLAHAALLLSSTRQSVTAIALECGFADASHFGRAFKERFGRPPRSYRQPASEIALVVDR